MNRKLSVKVHDEKIRKIIRNMNAVNIKRKFLFDGIAFYFLCFYQDRELVTVMSLENTAVGMVLLTMAGSGVKFITLEKYMALSQFCIPFLPRAVLPQPELPNHLIP